MVTAGTALRSAIERYVEEVEFRYGYDRVVTPTIAKKNSMRYRVIFLITGILCFLLYPLVRQIKLLKKPIICGP